MFFKKMFVLLLVKDLRNLWQEGEINRKEKDENQESKEMKISTKLSPRD